MLMSSCVNDDALMIYNLCAARRYHLFENLGDFRSKVRAFAAEVRDILMSPADGTVACRAHSRRSCTMT